jgi:hypothetical protein
MKISSEALELITAEYEELPAVFDPEQAMLRLNLHEDLKHYETRFLRRRNIR